MCVRFRNGCFEPNDFVNEELFHDDLFLEAMEAYTTYGKMESIVCRSQHERRSWDRRIAEITCFNCLQGMK